ncbi:MAG: amidohydrolase family protein [Myxococcaceae bacterium]
MGTLLKGGTLVELEPALVEVSDLRVEGGVITARGQNLTPLPGEEVIDARGKTLLPGLVNAHHHLYWALARGMSAPARPAETFEDVLEHVWWRLDQALDLDSIQISATVAALEALSSGTTTVVDHHASPRAITGALTKVARGLNDVGLRGVLAYEVTDRHGALAREEGLEETVAFVKKAKGRFRGLIGAHASFTLSDDALQGLKEAVESTQAGLHIHLAEDPSDERLSVERYKETPVNRLMSWGLLTPKTLIAHAVHLSWPELSTVLSTGTWLLHNPRSNMYNQVGYAPAGKFGARATLGTDGMGSDMFQEAKIASLRARDAGQPVDVLRYLANGHRLASQIFDAKIGPLREGAQADLLVLEYRSPTPLTSENLAGHFLFGFDSRHVESVMVEGAWRLWARRALAVNPETVHEEARHAATALWARMAKISSGQMRTPASPVAASAQAAGTQNAASMQAGATPSGTDAAAAKSAAPSKSPAEPITSPVHPVAASNDEVAAELTQTLVEAPKSPPDETFDDNATLQPEPLALEKALDDEPPTASVIDDPSARPPPPALLPETKPVIALEPEQVVPATPTPKGKGKGRPSTKHVPPVLLPAEGKPPEGGNAEGGGQKKTRAKA